MEILDVLAKMDEHLARQDALAKQDEHLARQDEILARMDDRMAKLTEFMAACHHEATAAHQTAAVALSRFAEVSLGVDRFVASLSGSWPTESSPQQLVSETSPYRNCSTTGEEARPMAETNNTQDLLATLRDALRALELTLPLARESVDEIAKRSASGTAWRCATYSSVRTPRSG